MHFVHHYKTKLCWLVVIVLLHDGYLHTLPLTVWEWTLTKGLVALFPHLLLTGNPQAPGNVWHLNLQFFCFEIDSYCTSSTWRVFSYLWELVQGHADCSTFPHILWNPGQLHIDWQVDASLNGHPTYPCFCCICEIINTSVHELLCPYLPLGRL